jgi:hypothetical protein
MRAIGAWAGGPEARAHRVLNVLSVLAASNELDVHNIGPSRTPR